MKDRHGEPVVPGDLIQLPPSHDPFCFCLAVVTEARAWGVVADIYLPHGKLAPARFPSADFVRVGKAKWRMD